MDDDTVVVCSSDHGDMQMEHQQFYKMAAFEASSRVPLVIAGPGISKNIEVLTLHSLVRQRAQRALECTRACRLLVDLVDAMLMSLLSYTDIGMARRVP
jgi:hypothetical protein